VQKKSEDELSFNILAVCVVTTFSRMICPFYRISRIANLFNVLGGP